MEYTTDEDYESSLEPVNCEPFDVSLDADIAVEAYKITDDDVR